METTSRQPRPLTDPPAGAPGGETLIEAARETAPRGEAVELARLARHLGEQHPEVSADTLSALVEHADDALADARVQNFRLILVERAVRRELAARRSWPGEGWSTRLDTAIGASDHAAPRPSGSGGPLR
jgi:hypothetical protein